MRAPHAGIAFVAWPPSGPQDLHRIPRSEAGKVRRHCDGPPSATPRPTAEWEAAAEQAAAAAERAAAAAERAAAVAERPPARPTPRGLPAGVHRETPRLRAAGAAPMDPAGRLRPSTATRRSRAALAASWAREDRHISPGGSGLSLCLALRRFVACGGVEAPTFERPLTRVLATPRRREGRRRKYENRQIEAGTRAAAGRGGSPGPCEGEPGSARNRSRPRRPRRPR
jgi:hypothetical protein